MGALSEDVVKEAVHDRLGDRSGIEVAGTTSGISR
jgi:hypothetical protein